MEGTNERGAGLGGETNTMFSWCRSGFTLLNGGCMPLDERAGLVLPPYVFMLAFCLGSYEYWNLAH